MSDLIQITKIHTLKNNSPINNGNSYRNIPKLFIPIMLNQINVSSSSTHLFLFV